MRRDQKGDEPRYLLDEGSLWIMVAAPSVWAAHFLLIYWVAAVWCAKIAGGAGPLGAAQPIIWGLTVAALLGIGLLARLAVRRYDGELMIEEDFTDDTDDHRKRFLGHATLLLCSLSAVGVLFDALPSVVFGACR